MKSVILTALVLCLILCGCADFASDRYYFVTPHTEQTVQPENADITVVTFVQLRQALKDMIQEGVESRVVYVPNYNLSRLEEDCRRVVEEVMQVDPIAAYAVENISMEQGINGGQQVLAVNITYWHDRTQIRRIRTVQTIEEAKTAIVSELDQCSAGIVLLVKEFQEADFAQLVEDHAARSPQTVMEVPQTTVNIYPEEGTERVIELKFTYQTSRDFLRTMQSQVSPIIESAVLYVSGDNTEHEKFMLLYAFLMELRDYQVGTSITPAYSLLRHGVGDYKAFANVYAALCREAGLECVTVSGTRDGEPWLWNLIRIGEEHFHVDLLRSSEQGGFRYCKAAQMEGYVWDYSAFPDSAQMIPARDE